MPAWDNVQLQGPPQAPSYNAPNIGIQLGALLGNLPQDYLQGAQQRAQLQFLQGINQFLPGGNNADNAGALPDPLAGGQAAATPSAGGQTATADPRNKIPVIMAAAQKYGVDPRVAVAVARSEGLAQFSGDGGKSGGAFQLYTGGGLGNDFQKETGLDPLDQKNEDATIDWAMRNAARTGWKPYNGAKKIGITGFQGIGQQTASTDPNFVPQQGAQPVQASAESPQEPAQPTTQVAQAAPQQAPQAQGGAASALLPPGFPGTPQQAVQRLDDAIRNGNEKLGQLRDVKVKMGPIEINANARRAEALQAQIKDWQDQRNRISDAIKQEAEPTGAQKEARDPAILQRKGQEEAQTAAQKRSDNRYNAYQAASESYAGTGGLKDNLDLSRSILSDPRSYTGFGAERTLNFDRAKAGYIGDQKAAVLKEVLQKTRAETILNTMKDMRDDASGAGQNAGRFFKSTIENIEKSVPGLETSKSGNLALVEIQRRLGDYQVVRKQAADEYLETHPRLDAGFDRALEQKMRGHPMFSEEEKRDPTLLGAPTVPQGITRDEYARWGKAFGLKPGVDAVRTPSGGLRLFVPVPGT